ncbi:alpha/beta fold hydrolase [Candidatus Binatia bacterium]|nr:alpha/beta fold hydrolase [Candidatus Binatia bacterium]
MTLALHAERWCRVPRPRVEPLLRLYCFPYAGAGAWLFRDWGEQLPESTEVVAVELPGRGTRMAEEPVTRLAALASELAERLAERPGAFALFGHSFGGLLAFEVAQALRCRGRTPLHLFVSATLPPQLCRPARRLHELEREALVRELVRLGGIPPEILADRAFLERVLKPVRADLEAFETHEFAPGAPLRCPITVFGGTRDPSVSRRQLEEWSLHTEAEFALQMLPGDHFFVRAPQSGLLAAVRARLDSAMELR